MLARLALALLLAAVTALPAATPAAAAAPREWLGVNLEVPPLAKRGAVDGELRRMRRAGVGSVRFAVYWSQLEPARGRFRFRALDRVVAAAARARVAVLPVVLAAPAWAAAVPMQQISPPRDPADYARFVGRLVHRYGAGGTFWRGRPRRARLPIRRWHVWNEISNPFYWGPGWPAEYPRLLAAAYRAIKAADRGATVVMAGINTLAASSGNPYTSWQGLDEIYRQLDAQDLGRPFDVASVHVFTRRVGDVVRVVRETRRVMAAHGDRARPLRVTELSWPASRGRLRDPFFAETNARGMARRLAAGLRQLAANRARYGLEGVDWFQWSSPYTGTRDPFQYAGLRRIERRRIVDTPALAAFRAVSRRLRG